MAYPRMGRPRLSLPSARRQCRCCGTLLRRIHSVNQLVAGNAQIDAVIPALPVLADHGALVAHVVQADARKAGNLVSSGSTLLVTDPPYYAQINYADLSDYFYLWIRRAMRGVHPDLFATMATPKEGELVANPARYGGSREKARRAFINGLHRGLLVAEGSRRVRTCRWWWRTHTSRTRKWWMASPPPDGNPS